MKRRINASQEFVIGYIPSHLGVDSIVIGFYRDKQLRYAARVRAGFVPVTRRQAFERIKTLEGSDTVSSRAQMSFLCRRA